MTLLEQIEHLWNENGAEARTCEWARKLVANKGKIAEAIKQFNEWKPLYVYTSVTRGMQSTVKFSLRYCGQEVGELVIKDQDVRLKVSDKTSESNSAYFGISPGLRGEWDWRAPEATQFRRAFWEAKPIKFKSEEKRIEAAILREMMGKSSKFSGSLNNITPVRFVECPFQFPLPLSGNKGFPEANNGGNGNIDILARRGAGFASKLSVWELKAPGEEKNHFPIEQAYIYTVTLLKMLRSSCGPTWYKEILGYDRSLREKISIESVAVVSPKNDRDRQLFLERFALFKQSNRFMVGEDEILPIVAFYEPNSLSIELIK